MKTTLFTGLVGAGLLLTSNPATAQDAPKAEKQKRVVIKQQQQAEKKNAQLMERAMKLSQKASDLAAAGKTQQAADAAAKAAELLKKAAGATSDAPKEGVVKIGDEAIEYRVRVAEALEGHEHAHEHAHEYIVDLHEHLAENAADVWVQRIDQQGKPKGQAQIRLSPEAVADAQGRIQLLLTGEDGELQEQIIEFKDYADVEGQYAMDLSALNGALAEVEIDLSELGVDMADLQLDLAEMLGDVENNVDVRVLHHLDGEHGAWIEAIEGLDALEGVEGLHALHSLEGLEGLVELEALAAFGDLGADGQAYALVVPEMGELAEGAYAFNWSTMDPSMECEVEMECEDCCGDCGGSKDSAEAIAFWTGAAENGEGGVWSFEIDTEMGDNVWHREGGASLFVPGGNSQALVIPGQKQGHSFFAPGQQNEEVEHIHILGQGGSITINGGEDGEQNIYIYGGSAMPQAQGQVRMHRFQAPTAQLPKAPKASGIYRYEVETDGKGQFAFPQARVRVLPEALDPSQFEVDVRVETAPNPFMKRVEAPAQAPVIRGQVRTKDGEVVRDALLRATDASGPAPSKADDAEAIIREMRAEMEALRQELQDLRRQMKDDPLVRSDLSEGAWRRAEQRGRRAETAPNAVVDRRRAGLASR